MDKNNAMPVYSKMFNDYILNRQPENTYTYSLNSVVRNNILSTEYGFILKNQIKPGYIIVSTSYMSNNRVVVFSTNNNLSEIGIFDGTIYITHVNAKLNFSNLYKIDCTYRLRNGCEDVIYFTDDYNPIRFFNFSRSSNFKSNGEWNVNKFNLIKNAKIPNISNIKVVESGGRIKAGSVIFAIQYLDDDLNPTHFVHSTHPILLYKGSTDLPIGTYDDLLIAKSVEFNITNIDEDFKFYRIAVAYINNKLGTISEVKYSERFPITQNKYVFNNLDDLYDGLLSDVVAFKTDINRANAIEQIDNQLILGNVKGTKIDAAAHQKLASKIGVGCVFKTVDKINTKSSYHPNNPNYLEFASHMPNEVISLGITYVDSKTGQESGPHHIPGRPLDVNPFTCEDLSDIYNGQSQTIKTKCAKISITLAETINEWVIINYSYKPNNSSEIIDIVKRINIYGSLGETVIREICVKESTISFTINSITYERNGNTIDQDKYTIQYYIKENTVVESSNTLNGWDSTVYANNNRDSVGAGWETAEAIIIAFRRFYGNSTALSAELLNRKPFLDFMKQLILDKEIDHPLRWEVYNTARLVDDGKIIMAYYETKNSYYQDPINSDCIDDYWGTDICGNPLTGQRIRHHRLPDRKLIPTDTGNNINLLGLEFFNIEYPQGYDSHYFSCGIKTEGDKTVLDNGIVTRQLKMPNTFSSQFFREFFKEKKYKGSGYIYNHYRRNTLEVSVPGGPTFREDGNDWFGNKDDVGFYSPSTLLNLTNVQGYLRYYYPYADIPTTAINDLIIESELLEYQETSQLQGADDTNIVYGRFNMKRGQLGTTITNLPIKDVHSIPVLGTHYDSDGYKIVNLSISNRLTYLKGLERELPTIGYASIMINKDVYNNLDTITYRKLHNNLLTINEVQEIYGGDTYVTKFNLVNYVTAFYDADSIGPLLSAFSAALNAFLEAASTGNLYLALGVGGAVLAAGITQASIDDAMTNLRNNNYKWFLEHYLQAQAGNAGGDGLIAYIVEIFDGIYIDSYINWELRVDGNDDCTKVLRTLSAPAIKAHLQNKFFTAPLTTEEKENQGDDGRILRPIVCPEFYYINNDFNPILYAKRYYPIPSTYNHCSQCKEEFTNRIPYSLQSFQEELTDNYRVFLPNNYKDIQSEFGPIVDLYKKDNMLFISTQEALLEQPRNFQERVTDQLVSFIGTGSYFEIPAREVISASNGRLGNVGKFSTLVLPEGVLLIDVTHLKIWLLQSGTHKTDQTKNINNLAGEEYGYKEFLELNIPLNLVNYFPELKTNSYHYCGFHAAYDEIEKRILITKKDYIPKNKDIKFIGNSFMLNNAIIDINDNTYFYNRCWTLSFSMLNDGWISFHSYIPDNYITFKNSLYANLNDNNLWRFHEKSKLASYFGIKYPHIVEFVINNQFIKHLYQSITLSTTNSKWNEEYKSYINDVKRSFNKLLVYNERQCSGYVDLDVQQEFNDDSNVLRRVDNWNINTFRDMVTDLNVPIFIENEQIDYRYSNKVLNEECIDLNKNWQDQYYFNSKYLVIRLIMDKFDDLKISTDISVVNQLPHLKY
jgi:hypothetical protein